MADSYTGEDQRTELAFKECTHEYAVPVCVECGASMPAPHPGYLYGRDWDTQDWSDWDA